MGGFGLSPGAEAFRLPFPLNPPQGPMVFAAGHYAESDGNYREGFNPLNASKAVKLGYGEYLDNTIPDGVSIKSRRGWIEEGLASVESGATYPIENWKGNVLDAIHNTNTINFVITGIDIFTRPDRYKAYARTHWEMDQIIMLNYLDKLHLWRNEKEITGQERSDWIDKWKELRGIP